MRKPEKLLLVLTMILLMFSDFGTSALAMGNTDSSGQRLSRVTSLANVPLRDGTPLLRRVRESNLLSRRILVLKIEVAALQSPLMQTLRERVNAPDGLTGDQLVALKDAIRILQRLRLEVRHLNGQLLEQRVALRSYRLERNTTAATATLDEMITLQQQLVKSMESSIRVIYGMDLDAP